MIGYNIIDSEQYLKIFSRKELLLPNVVHGDKEIIIKKPDVVDNAVDDKFYYDNIEILDVNWLQYSRHEIMC